MRTAIIIFICLFISVPILAQDLGVRDTVEIVCDGLVVGQSKPIGIKIVNDDPLKAISTGFIITFTEGNSAIYDSARVVNRLHDPSIFDVRNTLFLEDPSWYDNRILNEFNDKFGIVTYNLFGNDLPPGNDIIVEFYYTGLATGKATVDSSFFPNSVYFKIISSIAPDSYIPVVVSSTFDITSESSPPVISTNLDRDTYTIGDIIEFNVIGSSNNGDVVVSFKEISDYDLGSTNQTTPLISGINDSLHFEWELQMSDIGIWKVIFEACDSLSECSQLELVVQIVKNDQYLVDFELQGLDSIGYPTGFTVGDFDNDLYPECVFTSYPISYGPDIVSIDYNILNQQLEKKWEHYNPSVKYGIQSIYMNNDDHLDIIMSVKYSAIMPKMITFWGDGNGKFSETGMINLDDVMGSSTVVCNINNDRFIDLATNLNNEFNVLLGDSNYTFVQFDKVVLNETILSINSADFNLDGYDDVGVGTETGLHIFLNDQQGQMVFKEFHPQTYGSADVDVTNKGSDFNNDKYYDICTAAPSIGLEFSEIIVYLGQSGGSFTPHFTKQVKGQVFSNTVGDFNDDNILDIAYVNGAEKKMGILFGNDNGNWQFDNELRFDIPKYSPTQITSLDIDLDGDLDIIVGANDTYRENSLYLFTNNLNPVGYQPTAFSISAENNVELDISSTSGDKINKYHNSFSAGAYNPINSDNNSKIDAKIDINAIEEGEYILSARPVPDATVNDIFSIEFQLNDEKYRLAKNQPMSAAGYKFGLFPGSISSVYPIPGSFVAENITSFIWDDIGDVNWQLATDLDFSNLIKDTTIANSQIQLSLGLTDNDTTAYFWRYKNTSDIEYDKIYVINRIPGIPTDIVINDGNLPNKYYLSQNYPNPFNPSTLIEYGLPVGSHVELCIYNIRGERVAKLVERYQSAGNYSVEWNIENHSNENLASGIYLIYLKTDSFESSKKMILLK